MTTNKTFVLKTLVAAMTLAFAGQAVAAAVVNNVTPTPINLDASPTGAAVYASQLTLTATNPLTAGMNFVTKLGFGVSNTQTRYIRLQYGNATLSTAHINTDVELTSAATTGHLTAAVAQGGAIGDNYVIYQITAGADYAATESVDFLVRSLAVTSNASPVTITYQLHETAVSAVAGATGTSLLYSKAGNLATFATGLGFALTPNTQTAAVETSFKKFCASATNCTSASSVLTQPLGVVAYDVTAAKNRAGVTLILADLLTTANIVFTGNFSAAAAATNVFLATPSGTPVNPCGNVVGPTSVLNTGKTTATFVVNTTALAAGANLCYTVDGIAALPAQTVLGELVVVTKPADTTTASVAPASAGVIVRDGTELQSPFFTNFTGYSSRFILTNKSATDAAYTTSYLTETGNTCTPGAGATGTIPANGQLVVLTRNVCSFTAGQPVRGAVVFTIAAPSSVIQGATYIQAPDGGVTTSGMMRPGTN